MLKTLIKKQYMELFRSYFVNQKTGQPRSHGKVIGMFVLFGFLMVFSSAMFFLVAAGLGSSLLEMGLGWLYFTILGMIAVLFGTFGSVFNTYAGLYRAKDNDLLISMPIPPGRILFARVSGVYGLSLLYSALVWVPACIYYWAFGSPSVIAVVFDVLLIFVIAFFVSVLTCLLGWVVALIAGKLKNKSFVVVLITLVFLGLYYFVCFKMSDFMTSLIANADAVGNTMKNWFNFLYQLGHAAVGEVVPMLIFTVITFALAAICYYVLSRTFIRIATAKTSEKKAVYVEKTAKQKGVRKALFMRELKHFTSNPTYMLNCGLGVAFMIAVPVLLFINRTKVLMIIAMLGEEMPGNVMTALPLFLAGAMALMAGLNMISTPSVSLEGKSLWILRSLPVRTSTVLEEKANLHFTINEIPIILAVVVSGVILKLDAVSIILALLIATLYNLFIALFGLMMGVSRPNLIWTSEMQPIKQSTNVLLVMLVGWVMTAAIVGLYFLLKVPFSVNIYCAIWVVLLAVMDLLLLKWMRTVGVRKLEEL